MIEDNERSVLSPKPGDVWERNGIAEMVVLSVGKLTLEYCDEKIHYGPPGIWEWDLGNFRTMPVGNLKRYVCESVGLDEEPVDYRLCISPTDVLLSVVHKFNQKMNRQVKESSREVVQVAGHTLDFDRRDVDGKCILAYGDKSYELSLSILWELGERAYEFNEVVIDG